MRIGSCSCYEIAVSYRAKNNNSFWTNNAKEVAIAVECRLDLAWF